MQQELDHSILERYMLLKDTHEATGKAVTELGAEIKRRLTERDALGLADEQIRCETEFGRGFYNPAVLKGLWSSEAVPHAELNQAWSKAVRAKDLDPEEIIKGGTFNVAKLKPILKRYGGDAMAILNRAFQRGKPKLVIEWRVIHHCTLCGRKTLSNEEMPKGDLCAGCVEKVLEAQRQELKADELGTAEADLAREEDPELATEPEPYEGVAGIHGLELDKGNNGREEAPF